MEAEFTPKARAEFLSLDKQLQKIFQKHIIKICKMPPRRHMRHGVPCHVENVTRQTRIVYNEEEKTLLILHCFATHKEYERWYRAQE